MPKVFISHVRADRVQARRLAEVLRHEGYTPWIAEDEARVGEQLAETLARGLRDTQAAVLLISRASVESGWTSVEAVLLAEQARGTLRQCVARLDHVTPPPEVVQNEFVDLFPGETAWRSGMRRLRHLLMEDSPLESSARPSALPPNNLPPQAAPFVGREQELATLHERLMAGPPASRVVLCGPRGIGKTALAVEYAKRHADDYPGGIWWIPARLGPRRALTWLSTSLRLNDAASALKQLAKHALDASYEDIARCVSQTVQSNSATALLILDDMKGGRWQDYLPTGHARVLVTSRAASPTRLRPAFVQHLRPLPPLEAGELLGAFSPHTAPPQDIVRDRLLEEWLRGNPLLVMLAARLIAHLQISWDDLERELAQRVPLASGGQSTAVCAARATAVVDLCIEQFPSDTLERQLLEGASVFAHDLTLDSLLAWATATGQHPILDEMPGEATEAFLTLHRSGLLSYAEPYCQLHRAIAQRVRALTPPQSWARLTDQGLAATSEWIHEQEQYDTYEPWVTEEGIPHLEAVLRASAPQPRPHMWVETASLLAGRFSRRGEPLAAKALRKHALHRAEQGLHTPVEYINGLRAALASTHEELGNLTAAQRLLEQAVAEDASNSQGSPERKAQRLAALARLRLTRQQPAAALTSIDEALRLDREALAERHPRFPMRLFLRARILRILGRNDEAHEVLEEALTKGERLSEKGLYALTPILESLAESRRERHDEKGALALLERVIDEDRHLLGDAHYKTVFHLTELARTYAAFERRTQARTCVERVLPLLDEALTPTDPRCSELLLKLAEVLGRVGAHQEAHSLLERVVDIEARQPAPDFDRLSYLVVSSLLWRAPEDDSGTNIILERVLTLTRHAPPGTHAAARRLEKRLSHLLHTREPSSVPPSPSTPLHKPSPGKGAEALERALRLSRGNKVRDEVKADALREAIDAAKQGDDPTNGARALFLLADLEGRRGAWERARASALDGLQLALRTDVPALVAEGYRLLGDAALHGSFYEEACMSYAEAIRRYDGLEEHRRAAQTRALLVTLLLQLSRLEGVEEHVRWLAAHQSHPALTGEDRRDLREVLALVDRRLSAPTSAARHSKP